MRGRDGPVEPLIATPTAFYVTYCCFSILERRMSFGNHNPGFGVVYLYDNDRLRIAATNNFTPEATNQLHELQQLKRPERSHLAGRAILDRALIHVPDVLKDPEYSRELALAGGWRAVLAIPLLSDGKPVGALSVAKAEPTPFSDRQIQLLKTSADQAVIAIENVRLFDEVQARTRELAESLDQQTATSEVLKVISRSPGELEPVFEAMLASATRICDAKFGNIYRWDGDSLRLVATHNTPPAYAQLRRSLPFRPGPETPTGRMMATKSATHVADLALEPGYVERDPLFVEGVEVGGIRTLLSVPMVKENELIGAFSIYRDEVRPFTDKQIELVKTFASQAVIAIENTRLLNELRESLQQQTATSEVLSVISSSPGELEPVFNAMLANATRICEATFGNLFLREGDGYRAATAHGEPAFVERWRRTPFVSLRDAPLLDRVTRTKQVLHIPDLRQDQSYRDGNQRIVALVDSAGARTFVSVPMLKDSEIVGTFAIYRQEVRPFTEKQIELVKNFAAQAVIAIENTRLLNELARIPPSSRPRPPRCLRSSAVRLATLSRFSTRCSKTLRGFARRNLATFILCEGDAFRTVAMHNVPPAFAEVRRRDPFGSPRTRKHPWPASHLQEDSSHSRRHRRTRLYRTPASVRHGRRTWRLSKPACGTNA